MFVSFTEPFNWLQHPGHNSATNLPEKAQDVHDLRQHLIDMWDGVEQNVIDDGIEHACIRATGWYFEYFFVTEISQNVSTKFKFIVKGEHLFQITVFPGIYVSQNNVATCSKCGGIIQDHFVTGSLLKIGQHSVKLWSRVRCPVVLLTG